MVQLGRQFILYHSAFGGLWSGINVSTIIIPPRWGCPEMKPTLRIPTPTPQNIN
jgi:hypothetical protein